MRKAFITCALGIIALGASQTGLHASLWTGAAALLSETEPSAQSADSASKDGRVFPAKTPQQVVELFTSQGCSSCPQANALLAILNAEDGVLGLSYSVDYWDYLGWSDTFADPSFTERQRAYSTAIGHKRVYTPQIVVNGSFDKPRLKKAEVMDNAIHEGGPHITLRRDGTVSLGATNVTSATVRLIHYVPGTQTVPVKSGENSGRVIRLTNVVTHIADLGQYSGSAQNYALKPDQLKALSASGNAFAVLVQKDNCGTILAAADYSL